MADLGTRQSNRIKSKHNSVVSETKEKKKRVRRQFTLCNFKPEGVYESSDFYEQSKADGFPFNMEACLTDKRDLNQLVIRYGPIMDVLLINPTLRKAYRVCQSWNHYIKGDVHWSPRGSYLFSHLENMAFILGEFRTAPSICMRFDHAKVNLLDFSPGEKYFVTYNRPKRNSPSELKIFDVRTGRILMGGYHCPADVSWPLIRWAGGEDDNYFAMRIKTTVRIYETQTFNLLGDKFDDVTDISWCPTGSILGLLCGKQTTKIVLVQIPDMKELRHKDLFQVYDDCKMYWQSNGEYLAVKVTGSEFVFFRIRNGTPTEEEVLKVDEKILDFAWEPSGHRFAMIHGDQSKPLVSFYSLKNPNKVSKLARYQTKQADALFWSPRGRHIVLAGFKGGNFEFFDVDNLKTLGKVKHFMATVVAWDPTGRYVATAYTIPHEMEIGFKNGFVWGPPLDHKNGFFIWSFKGVKLYWKSTGEEYRLLQLQWRPNRESIDDEMLENLAESLEQESKLWPTVQDW